MMPRHTLIYRRTYDEFTPSLIDERWALYGAHHKITRERFVARLQDLDSHALFYLTSPHNAPQLVGIAGIRQQRVVCEGTMFNTIYLGQVFIAPHARRYMLIQRLVFSLFVEAKLSEPKTSAMFWVEALSFKPYLIVTNYLFEYHPHATRAPSPQLSALVESLGRQYYGEAFNPKTWAIYKAQHTLEDGAADISASDLTSYDGAALLLISRVRYDLEERMLSHEHFDPEHQQTPHSTQRQRYNSAGQLIERVQENPGHTLTHTISYDAAGNKLRERMVQRKDDAPTQEATHVLDTILRYHAPAAP